MDVKKSRSVKGPGLEVQDTDLSGLANDKKASGVAQWCGDEQWLRQSGRNPCRRESGHDLRTASRRKTVQQRADKADQRGSQAGFSHPAI